jgi:hypothetical protein
VEYYLIPKARVLMYMLWSVLSATERREKEGVSRDRESWREARGGRCCVATFSKPNIEHGCSLPLPLLLVSKIELRRAAGRIKNDGRLKFGCFRLIWDTPCKSLGTFRGLIELKVLNTQARGQG